MIVDMAATVPVNVDRNLNGDVKPLTSHCELWPLGINKLRQNKRCVIRNLVIFVHSTPFKAINGIHSQILFDDVALRNKNVIVTTCVCMGINKRMCKCI